MGVIFLVRSARSFPAPGGADHKTRKFAGTAACELFFSRNLWSYQPEKSPTLAQAREWLPKILSPAFSHLHRVVLITFPPLSGIFAILPTPLRPSRVSLSFQYQ